ncbi:MAG: RNA-binding protein [Thermoplasmatales archaeon]|jgi:small nuclear ribonucleoprotein|nr:RNA-binding protein [Candidatus Thermoplasmatota archaeon]MCL6002717.1 RNA-binding protein [Candidatus Thermoplasmatota archaeon]MDA8054708.1 RNA-binding protein [Thermoplasmatales archaeon]
MAVPMAVMQNMMQKPISLLLKDNTVLEGILESYDDYMNIVISNTEEITETNKRKLGTVILRGSNVVRISQK